MKNPFTDLKSMLHSMEDDFSKFFEKGNSAAGTRVRKSLKDLRDEAQKVRLEVQEHKNKEAAAKKKPAPAAAAKKK